MQRLYSNRSSRWDRHKRGSYLLLYVSVEFTGYSACISSPNTVFCIDITVGLLPHKMIRVAGAQGAAWLARLHYCASISASLPPRREWLTARRLPGCILESAASVRCSLAPMRQVSLPPRLPPPTLLGLGAQRSAAERDARRAHVVGGGRRDARREEEKERRLSCLSSALTLSSPPRSGPASSVRHPSGTDFFAHYCCRLPASAARLRSGTPTDRPPFQEACFTGTLLRNYF